jgi:small GTP-binding protein
MELNRTYKPEENKYLIKIVVVGDIGVGKTNIIRRILGQDFKEMEATIGVEFGYINIDNIDPDNPDIKLCLQIWDTSGAERYRSITTSHIRNADGAYIVYDIGNSNTFEKVQFWYDCIKNATDEDIVIYLIGNKSDIVYTEGRQVQKSKAVSFVKTNNLHGFVECSAKQNTGIENTFKLFYNTIYKNNKLKLKEKLDKKLNEMKRIKNLNEENNGCC